MSTFSSSTNTTLSFDYGGSTDDYVGNFDHTTVIYGASLSCLMISIPSACDCVIDMIPQWVVIVLFKDRRYTNTQNQAKSHGDDAGIKMTIAERLMFIIGVITLSAATFPDLQVISSWKNNFYSLDVFFLRTLSCCYHRCDCSILFSSFIRILERVEQ